MDFLTGALWTIGQVIVHATNAIKRSLTCLLLQLFVFPVCENVSLKDTIATKGTLDYLSTWGVLFK